VLKALKRLIPVRWKRRIRRYQQEREKVRLCGGLAPMVPPVEDMFDGPGSLAVFKANGEEFLNIYKEICRLQPDEKMLDVGSGIGRKTLPLTQYLNGQAVYEGIDIAKAGVDWCRDRITSRYPNFRFQQIDVYNKCYNPLGRHQASAYQFPFADESFTFVMLGSVFTHMLPADLEHYLSEVRRVLTAGGRCLISYFLLKDESRRLIEAGQSSFDFNYELDGYRTISREVLEEAIAFDETMIRGFYEKAGPKIVRIDYGSWCGRAEYRSSQDLILAVRE
jgi:ubiquinone/menaquinone biosynthesis C-methylase UbiE